MASKEINNEEVNEDEINEDKYLYAIIRKPQEGKTFICLENLRKNKRNKISFNISEITYPAEVILVLVDMRTHQTRTFNYDGCWTYGIQISCVPASRLTLNVSFSDAYAPPLRMFRFFFPISSRTYVNILRLTYRNYIKNPPMSNIRH